MDLVTPLLDAITVGAAAGAKDTATLVVKDSYAAFKALLNRRGVDVSGVEREPDSRGQRAALTESLQELASTPNAVDDELLTAAAATVAAVADTDADSARVVGVDLDDVRAAFIRIGTVVSSGDGVLVRNVHTTGGVDIGTVRAGDPQVR